MSAKKKIEQTEDALPESQTAETTAEITDGDGAETPAETTEQPSETEGSDGDETQGDDSEETETPPESEQSEETPPAPVVPELPPKDEKGADETAPAEPTAAKTATMTLRHKSHTPHYHRCGLTLTKVFADYEVPEDCVGRIKGDKWIEVKGAK